MSIERINTAGLGAVAEPRLRQTRTTPAAQATADVKVSLAHASTNMSAVTTEVSASRVSEIKQAIAEGRFKINPDAIADRLLDTARDLIRSKQPQ